MSKSATKLPFAVLVILQVVALLIYAPAFIAASPQALVMPVSLLFLLVLAFVGINTGTLTLESGRNLLVFLQGVNILVRMMSLFPNLRTAGDDWAWGLLITQLVGIGLAWYTITAIEKLPLQRLRFRQAG